MKLRLRLRLHADFHVNGRNLRFPLAVRRLTNAHPRIFNIFAISLLAFGELACAVAKARAMAVAGGPLANYAT